MNTRSINDHPPSDGASRRPRLAVTLGDPRGIGPEVAVRAAREPRPLGADLVFIGPEGVIDSEATEFVSVGIWRSGDDARTAGKLAGEAVERAVEMAMGGEVHAIVTAPISKPALNLAGYDWPGHTEMLRDLSGSDATALCMDGKPATGGSSLRVVLVTGHMALRDVPDLYTAERLREVGHLANRGLRRWWGLENPRLLVCGLNPHASDEGLFGDEEARICEPAIGQLRDEGIDVRGPLPADTVFLRAMSGEADAVLAPYHDVGMTAVKTACFGTAINVTLGLPYPRTAPDHGTAFDIAGTGRADPRSMRRALELAASFARRALTLATHTNRFPER